MIGDDRSGHRDDRSGPDHRGSSPPEGWFARTCALLAELAQHLAAWTGSVRGAWARPACAAASATSTPSTPSGATATPAPPPAARADEAAVVDALLADVLARDPSNGSALSVEGLKRRAPPARLRAATLHALILEGEGRLKKGPAAVVQAALKPEYTPCPAAASLEATLVRLRDQKAKLAPSAVEVLCRHGWPEAAPCPPRRRS